MRALDLDERLVGVAFLDVSVYVTSLRAVKNLLVIGDALKGVWLVAFQVRIFRNSCRRSLIGSLIVGGSVQVGRPGEGLLSYLRNLRRPLFRRGARIHHLV